MFNNSELVTKQLIHCSESITKNFGSIDPKNILSLLVCNKITVYEIPSEHTLDYTCIVTMEDTSATGGFIIKNHNSMTGQTCTPYFVISPYGHTKMLEQEPILCPICYTTLTSSNFEEVGPKTVQDSTIFDGVVNPFLMQPSSAPDVKSLQATMAHTSISGNNTVVFLKGTVGSGKTTFSKKLKSTLEDLGLKCIIIGTDNYCKTGINGRQAASMVTNDLTKFNAEDGDKVVIVDTCGENTNKKNVFGHNYSGWKIVYHEPNLIHSELKGYLSWSLRNVLNRSMSSATTDFWLNPFGAGVNKCVEVHLIKAKAVIKTKIIDVFPNYAFATKEVILESIKDDADRYIPCLTGNMTLDEQIKKLVSRIN